MVQLTAREWLLILAGAEAFHTLSHMTLGLFLELPLKLRWPKMTFTAGWNRVAILLNAAATIVLFRLALRA